LALRITKAFAKILTSFFTPIRCERNNVLRKCPERYMPF
jgi:hypothetical protein